VAWGWPRPEVTNDDDNKRGFPKWSQSVKKIKNRKIINLYIILSYSEDKSKFGREFDEDMKMFAERIFAWKSSDNVAKKVAECLRQLKGCLESRHLVS